MRIYTRTGDDGTTSLIGGERVSKSTPLLEAYGSLDELSSQLGLARALCASAELQTVLDELQDLLFELGAELASSGKRQRINSQHVSRLEQLIDQYEAQVPPLRSFVKPGGTPVAAVLHVARTVARRAERRIVALEDGIRVTRELRSCVNRMSDLLFVLARYANKVSGTLESEWHPNQ